MSPSRRRFIATADATPLAAAATFRTLSADEAKAYGLVDDVVQSRKEIPQLTAADKLTIADKEKSQKEGKEGPKDGPAPV